MSLQQLEMWTEPRPERTGPATHLRLDSDIPVTACGQKIAWPTSGFPYVIAAHAPMHIAGHGMAVCANCAAVTTVVPQPKEI